MCGIATLISFSDFNISDEIKKMTDIIKHRGPDDEGFFLNDGENSYIVGGDDTNEECYKSRLPYAPKNPFYADKKLNVKIAFGHRRLSILDVSVAGHQPMSYRQRYWIIFNGEIYNHVELKTELKKLGHSFFSSSDTEVILASYCEWGKNCLNKFNGMFSFVIYDDLKKTFFAARDRFGVKPLYYWFSPNGFLAIASEIKQFTVLPGWKAKINGVRAYDFLRYSITDHNSDTLFKDVFQLRGGEYFECSIDKLSNLFLPIQRWYEIHPCALNMSFEEASLYFKKLFEDAVSIRLRADVPIGTGLSGGLDSSSIVCTLNNLLRKVNSDMEQHTFSSCSYIEKFDERKFIDIVTQNTNTMAHHVYLDVNDLLEDFDKIIWHQDEPFCGASIFAEWEVFKLVSETPVKVTLDGHGADELLAGYHNFFGSYFVECFCNMEFKKLFSEVYAAKKLHGYNINKLKSPLLNLLIPDLLMNTAISLDNKLKNSDKYLNLEKIGLDGEYVSNLKKMNFNNIYNASISQLLYTSLPHQLHWSDRDSMAYSIESRAPFLDYRIVEFLLSCPSDYKINNGTTKSILRNGLKDVLPTEIVNRRDKMGFVTPEEVWVKTNSKKFKNLLEQSIELSEGIFNEHAFAKGMQVINGTAPYSNLVWNMIVFGKWIKQFSIAI